MSNASEVRHLLVIADQKSRRIVSLTDDTYSIGRDPHSNILLYDRQVSRHHATLLRVGDHNSGQICYRIVDGNLQGKKSTNGITINGQYSVSHELVRGDFIRFGNNSYANYHIIADSAELALLKDGDADTQMVDNFISNNQRNGINNVDSFDNIFLEEGAEDEDQPQTMSFKKDSKAQVSLADSNPNPIIEIDFDGKITYLNAAAKIKFSDLTQLQVSHPILKNLLGEKTPKDGTSFVREIDFEQRFFEQHIHYLKEDKCLRTYLFEVTKYRKREAKLTAGKNRYRFFFEQAQEGILVIDPQTKHIIETNQAYCQLLGYSMAEIIGSSLYQLLETDRDSFNQILGSITTDNPYIIKESFHRHANGSLLAIGGQINLSTYQGKEVFCVVTRDIRDRKQAEEELQYKLLHDPLTNLPNRDLFKEQLGVALAHAQRHEHLLAVIFIDIDSFTHINNTLGHSLGDRVLQSFG
ncbi:MAG: diguanylate cyclase, partial [Crocosphaera sp.]|nr:diguanylate cyclase [Crocosphaera sp.]